MKSIKELLIEHQALPTLDFLLLLGAAAERPKAWLLAHPEYCPTIAERWRLARYVNKYCRGFSVAAITQRKEFFGLDFYVNKHVLIPRPETELLVENALAEIANLKSPPASLREALRAGKILNQKLILIDVGTGSGCIPIAINKSAKQTIYKTIAIDISRRALRVAKKNARTHKVSINFLRGNLLEPILKQKKQLTINKKQIIVTANLPYLTQTQFAAEKSIQKEPRLALVGGQTGLELYEKLLQQIAKLTTDYGLQTTATNIMAVNRSPSTVVLLEIDPAQSPTITTLLKKYLPRAEIKIKPDLGLRDRMVIIKI